jgi:hypothetical protein
LAVGFVDGRFAGATPWVDLRNAAVLEALVRLFGLPSEGRL